MALTDATVKAAKLPDGKSQKKLTDGGGLYLLVNKSGKYWRYDYKLDGRRRTLAIGTYPDVRLAGYKDKSGEYKKGARDLLNDAKALIKLGIDPSQKKQSDRRDKLAQATAQKEQESVDANTFEVVARQWHSTHKKNWSDKHATTILRRFELHVFPAIGSVPVAKLRKSQVADVLTSIVEHGSVEIAKRIGQIVRQVLEFASDKGLIDAIPMGSVKTLIPARKAKPMAAIIEPKRIGELMRAIHAYQGTFVVCCALRLLPLLAVRSGEFRTAEWCEFNLDDAMWTIPAAHRKLKKAAKENPDNVHLVPLSTQAVATLKELHQLTGRGRHVFPSARGDARPMSENTINVALHAMGFKGEMVGHGVRAMFSSSLNEQRFNPDAIERQLAHAEKNAVRSAYNRSDYMDERVEMMQHWADYLDGLRTGADVIPIKRKA